MPRPDKKDDLSPDPKSIEHDLWDLDDEEAEEATPAPSATDEAEAAEEVGETAEAGAAEETQDEVPEETGMADPAPEKPAPIAELPAEAVSDSAPAEKSLLFRFLGRLKPAEKISLLLFLVLTLGASFWLLAALNPPGDWLTSQEDQTDYPVAGQSLTIENITSTWRKPRRSGDERDRGVRLGTSLIPTARVTLSGQGSGSLRFIFHDEEDRIAGDTITHQIQNGQFSNGSQTIEVYSTVGFAAASQFNKYLLGDNPAWTLRVYEVTAAESDPAPLITTPIAPVLNED
ncbi:MAG: hypothetical protein ACQKBY_00700 [Verrucomicrobiales bacterium]